MEKRIFGRTSQMNRFLAVTIVALFVLLPSLVVAKDSIPKGKSKQKAAPANPVPPKDGDLDMQFTPNNAQIRVWQKAKWVTIHNQRIDPNMRPNAAGVLYDHKAMAQYFKWAKSEKEPRKGVYFVLIQQSHDWMAFDGDNKKPIAGFNCMHFYHFIVDPVSAKVVKHHIGNQQSHFEPEKPKQQKPEKPKTDKVT